MGWPVVSPCIIWYYYPGYVVISWVYVAGEEGGAEGGDYSYSESEDEDEDESSGEDEASEEDEKPAADAAPQLPAAK